MAENSRIEDAAHAVKILCSCQVMETAHCHNDTWMETRCKHCHKSLSGGGGHADDCIVFEAAEYIYDLEDQARNLLDVISMGDDE